ncbi:MAG: 5'/3'-nucleotidase SurE [Oligoflexia bacterium]|nr:5'/3'-nucleotidase SurE [Oligoflexia bacterium]
MMRILISNDDGVHAPAIRVLARELGKLGEVWVVAPLEEKSTAGHSLTLHKPLRIMRLPALGPRFYGVSGSPADCIYLGIREIMGQMPDLVVSGINRGANLGQDVYYSGTVSAAREACILGIPSMAVSLAIDFAKKPSNSPVDELAHYESAAKLALEVLRKVDPDVVPKHTLLNLNVPDLPLGKIRGVKLARQGFQIYSGEILRRKDHRGKDYYWVGGKCRGFRKEDGTDCATVAAGYAALTPLQLDSTDQRCISELTAASRSGDVLVSRRGRTQRGRK